MSHMPTLKIADSVESESDSLELTQVFGFGEPMMALFIDGDDGDHCGINLNVTDATRVRDWLTKFIEVATK